MAARLLAAPISFVCRRQGTELQLCGVVGLSGPETGEVSLGEALCQQVMQERAPLVLANARADLRFRRELDGEGVEVVAFLGVPLLSGLQVQGVLAVLDVEPREWSADEVATLCELAEVAAEVVRAAELDQETEELSTALWRSEARYHRLTETSRSVIYALDRDGVITELNTAGAQLFGLPVSKLIGRNVRELIVPEDAELAHQLLCAGPGEPAPAQEVEIRALRPTGERRLLQVSAAPIVEDGAVVGTHGVARDITDERTRDMQLRRAERMVSVASLLGGVCHELNNPLTSIKSFAELLLLDQRTPEDREALEIIEREAHRAARIVTDLRVVARQSQETGTGREAVDVNAVIRDVLESRSEELLHGGIEVVSELTDGIPSAWAARAQVEQVVMQLVNNAAQALQGHSGHRRLTVGSYRSDGGVAFQVSDSGPGIPVDSLDHIFDPFWTTKQAGEGTGLGLSLVHSIVTDHAGSVSVDSKPGQGARFTVELPVADVSPAVLEEGGSETATQRPLRLLVVDDEAPIRYSLVRYMERRGHEVHEAADGAAALRLLDDAAALPYDLILADLRMPGLDGHQLWERLCGRGDGMDERLIFITGDADSADAEDLLKDTNVPVVQKPFELAQIAQVIEVHARMASL